MLDKRRIEEAIKKKVEGGTTSPKTMEDIYERSAQAVVELMAAASGSTPPPAATTTLPPVPATPKPDPSYTLKAGDLVIRGPHWEYANQDGGIGNVGMVVVVLDEDGWSHVKWPNGDVYAYQHNAEHQHIKRADASAVSAAKAVAGWPKLKKGDRVMRGPYFLAKGHVDIEDRKGHGMVIMDYQSSHGMVKVKWFKTGVVHVYGYNTDDRSVMLAPSGDDEPSKEDIESRSTIFQHGSGAKKVTGGFVDVFSNLCTCRYCKKLSGGK